MIIVEVYPTLRHVKNRLKELEEHSFKVDYSLMESTQDNTTLKVIDSLSIRKLESFNCDHIYVHCVCSEQEIDTLKKAVQVKKGSLHIGDSKEDITKC